MRILVFHGDLTQLSGGEVNARDWAFGFKKRGHDVCMYAPRLGPLTKELRRHGMVVVDDPSLISDAPDVIMGAGVNELATLIARFPRSAAVQVAQHWASWETLPCPLPQVVLHIAVDKINLELLTNEFGIPRERIRLVYNAVDVSRVVARTEPLAPRPRRLLVFANAAPGTDPHDYLPAIEQACTSRNIDFESGGRLIGRTITEPLQALGRYDIVVGAGRVALEAAACGAAVVVADGRGLAGMLTASDFEHFRMNNFGRELLVRPVTAELIGQEIDRYDPADARKVSDMILAAASLDRQLDEIEAIFGEAVGLLARLKLDDETSHRALSRYLALHLPRCAEGEAAPRHRPISTPSVDDRLKSLERGISEVASRGANFERSLERGISEVASRNADLERSLARGLSEVASRNADLERRLDPLFGLADSVNRNRAAINLLRPFAKALRAVMPGKPRR